MMLTRDTVTVASRIMLPSNVVAFVVVGVNYLTIPDRVVESSAALHYAFGIIRPLGWGSLFLSMGLLMAASLFLYRRLWMMYALALCSLSMGVWAGVFVAAAFQSDTVSRTAWLWPAYVSVACFASLCSVWEEET